MTRSLSLRLGQHSTHKFSSVYFHLLSTEMGDSRSGSKQTCLTVGTCLKCLLQLGRRVRGRESVIRDTQATIQCKRIVAPIAETSSLSPLLGVHFPASVRARCWGPVMSTPFICLLSRALRAGLVWEMYLCDPSGVVSTWTLLAGV